MQSQHSNESHCEADGYFSIRARLRKHNSVNDDVAKAYANIARRAVVCRARLLATQERLDGQMQELATSAGNLIGDNQNSITADAHGGSTLLEKIMKTIGRIATASAVAFSAFAFTVTPGSADPLAIIPHGHRCLSYFQGGTDCSFTSYGECEATASGQNAECYGNTPADDEDPWGTRRARQERPF